MKQSKEYILIYDITTHPFMIKFNGLQYTVSKEKEVVRDGVKVKITKDILFCTTITKALQKLTDLMLEILVNTFLIFHI